MPYLRGSENRPTSPKSSTETTYTGKTLANFEFRRHRAARRCPGGTRARPGRQPAFGPKWTGPHPILEVLGDAVYMIDQNGNPQAIHLDNIRPTPAPRVLRLETQPRTRTQRLLRQSQQTLFRYKRPSRRTWPSRQDLHKKASINTCLKFKTVAKSLLCIFSHRSPRERSLQRSHQASESALKRTVPASGRNPRRHGRQERIRKTSAKTGVRVATTRPYSDSGDRDDTGDELA